MNKKLEQVFKMILYNLTESGPFFTCWLFDWYRPPASALNLAGLAEDEKNKPGTHASFCTVQSTPGMRTLRYYGHPDII